MEPKNQPTKRWIIAVLLVLVAALVAVLLFTHSCQAEPAENIPDGSVPMIGYAEGVVVSDDAEELQKLLDEEREDSQGITLEYKGVATSTDGENFTCYIANAPENTYDMYLDIYADDALTDEVFLSGLIRPGNAFKEIKLNHPLPAGTTKVYVAFTQVEEDQATIHAQVLVTMDFVVTE